MHKYMALKQRVESPFCFAIRKYGWERTVSTYKVLEEVEHEDKYELNKLLIERENYWINKLNTLVPNGYNVHYSNHISPPTISNKEERYKKTSESLKGKYMNHESTSKPVRCIETGEIFPSCSEAERKMNLSVSGVNKVVNGVNLSVGGYSFEFVNEESKTRTKSRKQPKKPIICLETQEIFETARECSRIMFGSEEIKRSNIVSSCKKGWSCMGYHFQFYIEHDNTVPSLD